MLVRSLLAVLDSMYGKGYGTGLFKYKYGFRMFGCIHIHELRHVLRHCHNYM